jgi:hypothetical protein
MEAMAVHRSLQRLAAGLASALLSGISLAAGCRMPLQIHDATSGDIRAFTESEPERTDFKGNAHDALAERWR